MRCLAFRKRLYKGIFGKENEYETRKDIKYKKITEYSKKRWMWRMSDILPVCMQDFLYCRKPDM